MNTENNNTTTDTTKQENDRSALVKKIGRNTYRVHIHFSTTSTETMSDKVKRMLKNEIQQPFNDTNVCNLSLDIFSYV